jgi:hypothetical protein
VSGQYTNKLGRFHVTRGEIEKCEILGEYQEKKKNQGIVLLEAKVRKRFMFCFVNYLNLPLWTNGVTVKKGRDCRKKLVFKEDIIDCTK